MNYKKYKTDLTGLYGDSILCDEDVSIPYTAIIGILEELDILFRKYRKENIYCIALITDNSVAQALVLLYLLSAKVNFLLVGNHPPVEQRIPAFCDYMLTVLPELATGPDVARAVRLSANPGYKHAKFDFRRHSGSVFFMSSGTTGPPKYVRFEQRHLVKNAFNCVKRFAVDHRSRVLIPVPVHHMYGMGVGLLPALLSGASVCLINKTNIVKLLDRISSFKPDITLLTPAVVRMLLLLRHKTAGRGIYITAGEKLSGSAHAGFEDRYGVLYNLYGCTELGAIAVSEDGPSPHRTAGVVKPLESVEVRIENEGKSQILCRHNAGFDAYVDNSGRRLPAGDEDGAWFKTKDTGIDLGQAGFKVGGRVDNCINRHGFLVSLEEIGSLLESLFAEISQAVVFEGREEGLASELVAVCELAKGCSLDAGTVKKICRSTTQHHLVPDKFLFVEEIPRLNNGKADRTRLFDSYR